MSDLIEVVGTEPRLKKQNATIAEIVHAAHENGAQSVISTGTACGDGRKLDADAFEKVLIYCAEQQCGQAQVTCRTCRRHTQAEGLESFDQYLQQFETINCKDNNLSLSGPGQGTLEISSLEQHAQRWAGEEYWFWARRVLRKLRYGVRQVDDLIGPSETEAAPPAVILVEPQIPENIGMVARAMGNFGLDDLRIVSPRDGWPSEKARAVASGAAAIIDNATLHDDVGAAIQDLNWVAATTARQRDMRKPVMPPQEAAQAVTTSALGGERCGILFGRERNGLTTDEVALADAILMIPINNRFASLNLAQSVLLIGYEWLKATGSASLGRVTNNESPVETGVNLGKNRRATKQELLGLFEHLEGELEKKGFFTPSHRRHVVVRNIRTMLSRMDATDQEVRTLRGIVATLVRTRDTG
ncbi:MAG: RNA methyltransferase [Pseudomonadota bacterium]